MEAEEKNAAMTPCTLDTLLTQEPRCSAARGLRKKHDPMHDGQTSRTGAACSLWVEG
jgi:hypothetical protein